MRLGSIKFINSLPVDLGLLNGEITIDAEIVQGTPVELNEKMISGDLNVGPISAFWYAQHQSRFLLLPNLSISSESGVQSVLLLSRIKIGDLEGAQIALTGEGRTTPALLEILCRRRYGFAPKFKPAGSLAKDGIPKDADAILLIGDDALIAKEKYKNTDIEIVDLAQEWRRWTKRPIVFAVWAVRRDFFESSPQETLDAHQAILESKKWGIKNHLEVLKRSASETRLPQEVLEGYFKKLSYDFNEELSKGMKLYLEYATRCGLLKSFGKFEEIDKKCQFIKS